MADNQQFPVLETARLRLREINLDDAGNILSIHGDPDLMKWFGNTVADLDGARKLIEVLGGWRTLPDPGVRWGLEMKHEPDLIGTCGLFNWNRDRGQCTIGYELALNAQGQGLMREALESAITWGWEQMDGLVRIEARIHPLNEPSQHLAKSVGFEQEGLLRKAGFWNDQHHDLQVWSKIR